MNYCRDSHICSSIEWKGARQEEKERHMDASILNPDSLFVLDEKERDKKKNKKKKTLLPVDSLFVQALALPFKGKASLWMLFIIKNRRNMAASIYLSNN